MGSQLLTSTATETLPGVQVTVARRRMMPRLPLPTAAVMGIPSTEADTVTELATEASCSCAARDLLHDDSPPSEAAGATAAGRSESMTLYDPPGST